LQMKTVHLIAAARPNFMKVAPLYHALKKQDWCTPVLIHTGQHYDAAMSDVFFEDFSLPSPDFHLNVGSGSHAEQTGGVMIAYEKLCLENRPDVIVVVGDVNSTLACTLAGKKLHIPVAHLEAGLRSGDRSMPEEINRLATDALADLLWTPSADGDENLLREGIPQEKIELVGNIMIDSFEMLRSKIDIQEVWRRFSCEKGQYGVVTLHRPSNVDDRTIISGFVEGLERICVDLPLVFPVHPRTRKQLESFGLIARVAQIKGLHLSEPMNYVNFMSLVTGAKVVITDSGGVQEETSYLNIPCVTLRENTERPVTISKGSNELNSIAGMVGAVDLVLSGSWKKSDKIQHWDGQTAIRVANSLKRFLYRETVMS